MPNIPSTFSGQLDIYILWPLAFGFETLVLRKTEVVYLSNSSLPFPRQVGSRCPACDGEGLQGQAPCPGPGRPHAPTT